VYKKDKSLSTVEKLNHQKVFHLLLPLFTMESKALYGQIMSIDPQIRFATIANIDGKIEHTGHRGP